MLALPSLGTAVATLAASVPLAALVADLAHRRFERRLQAAELAQRVAEAARAHMEEERAREREAYDRLLKREEALARQNLTLHEDLRAEIARVTGEVVHMRAEIAALRDRAAAKEAEADKARRDLAAALKREDAAKRKISELETTVKSQGERLERQQEEIDDLKARLATLPEPSAVA